MVCRSNHFLSPTRNGTCWPSVTKRAKTNTWVQKSIKESNHETTMNQFASSTIVVIQQRGVLVLMSYSSIDPYPPHPSDEAGPPQVANLSSSRCDVRTTTVRASYGHTTSRASLLHDNPQTYRIIYPPKNRTTINHKAYVNHILITKLSLAICRACITTSASPPRS